jgi:metallophosphoesterase superfamily enzyme
MIDESDIVPAWLMQMEDGKNEIPDEIIITGKTAVLCDIHLGFHDIDAITACIMYLAKEKPENIILNGDLIDAHKLSRWAKRKDDIEFVMELKLARNFMDNLQKQFPNAKLYFKVGNHEDRLERYIMEKAEQFAGIVDWISLLELKQKGIAFVDSMQLMMVNSIWLAHGHELKVSGMSPAQALMNKVMSNCAIGHLHKTSTARKKTLDGEFIRCDSIGTLSKLKRGYMMHSQSNHGFAIIHEDGQMQNMIIEHGKVMK